MKYNKELSSKKSYVRNDDYKRQYEMNKGNVVNNVGHYNTQEINMKTGETSELIIEDNTVYEIDKECISCLTNKKK